MTEQDPVTREQAPRLRVLYVEDNPHDQLLARRALSRQAPEIELALASTLAEAMQCLAPPTPVYDVLLTDVLLPDGNGMALLRHVRERELPLAVALLTGSGDQDTALAALKAGADDYLVKRANYTDRLAQTLTTAIAHFRSGKLRHERPLRVLYAEHKAFDFDLTQRHFQQHAPHIRLDTVDDGAAVLARLPASAATPCDYDVLLIDYRLPGADALEITKTLHLERQLDLPIVIVTGQGSEEVVAAAMRLGVADFVVKHAGYLTRLPAVIEQAFHQAQLRREHAAQRMLSERLQRVLSASPAIVYTLRREGEALRPTWVSDNITRLFGFSVEECLVPDFWRDHLHPDDRAAVIAGLPRLFVDGQLVHEYRFLDRAGGVHRVRDQMRLLCDNDGQPGEVVGTWNDVTQEREATERLRLYGAALASSHDAVVLTDLTPRIIAVNPAFSAMTGYSEAEVLGKNPRLLKSGRQDLSFYREMWRCVLENGYWQGELWNRRKNGEIFPQWYSIDTVRDENGRPTHFVAVATDLSQLRHSEEQLHHLAHHDPLTGLPNRLLLELRLEHTIDRALRQAHGAGVLVVDQDSFKAINDSLGFAAGDYLLRAIAERLSTRLRGEDTLARPRGDQFVVVMEGLHDHHDAERMARDLLAALEAPFVLPDGHETFVRASIGISIFPQDGQRAADLLDKAGIAVNRAKALGGAQFCYYTEELNAQALGRLELETALRRALERNEFVLHFQPKANLDNGRISGAEALLRWRRPGYGLVPPMEFIPLAERSGLISGIGRWVIEESCRQMRTWLDAGLGDINLAVNVSVQQFRGNGLEQVITDALRKSTIAAGSVTLDLTESMLMERPDEAAMRLAKLKKIGVRISLDDFGTGYSSLGYLGRFPLDELKIDRSFVTNIVSDPSSAIIATSVIALAHRMDIEVVAEGVETAAQLGYLRRNRCDKMQGYYFSKPVPADEFATLLRQDKRLPALAVRPEVGTLLLVDDEPNVLSALRRVLRGERYRVLTAGSAAEALDILATNAVEVIVSDQRMPEMSGTEFLRRVKVLHPATVRIILSGYTDLESIIQAVNTGALFKFLTKPWDDNGLREHLRDAFRYHAAVVRPTIDARHGDPGSTD